MPAGVGQSQWCIKIAVGKYFVKCMPQPARPLFDAIGRVDQILAYFDQHVRESAGLRMDMNAVAVRAAAGIRFVVSDNDVVLATPDGTSDKTGEQRSKESTDTTV